jgi:hypothetical protein
VEVIWPWSQASVESIQIRNTLMHPSGTDTPVLFAVAGRIARNGTYCSSDANWKPRRPGQLYDMPFSEIKVHLMLEAIPEPGLQEEFTKSVCLLRVLTNANNVTGKLDVFCGNSSSTTIPLTHSIFEAVNKSDSKYPKPVFRWLAAAIKQSKLYVTIYHSCPAMFHNSIGDIGMFMETPTPAEVRHCSARHNGLNKCYRS